MVMDVLLHVVHDVSAEMVTFHSVFVLTSVW